jgi:hypothetical protein
MKKLKKLDIGDNDINEVNLDKLPRSLEKIKHSIELRPDCKLIGIISQLEKVRYG